MERFNYTFLVDVFAVAAATLNAATHFPQGALQKKIRLLSIWSGVKLEGQPACDISPFGSYGIQTIFLKNIAKNCGNCTSKVKLDAEIYGEDQFKRIIAPEAREQMINDFNQ